MSKFTASNGVEIRVGRDFSGDMYLMGKAGGSLVATCNPECVEALREFFQHEHDQELGRWRWPENPDVVVQADKGGERAWVMNERNQQINGWAWRVDLDRLTAHAQVGAAARAYFAAHPEPKKPWHDAKPGEVWLLSLNGEQRACGVVERLANPNTFVDPQARRPSFPVNDKWIESGRRIWPEDSNDS